MFRNRVCASLVLSLLFCILLTPCQALQLKESLDRYKTITVSNRAIQRLKPYNKLVDHYAKYTFFKRNHKVSPDFIRALILAESDANPRAVSSKGARGLGQIMYATGKQAALELSKSRFRFPQISRKRLANLQKNDLFDPGMNILLTCYLISKYNHKFKGRLDLVVTAWNAGEYHKELKKGRPAPYKETHNLIGKVNAYYIDLLRKRKRLSIKTKKW